MPLNTQLAVQLTGPDRMRLVRDKPVPEPGDGQILGRVECVGLCFSDVKLRQQFDRHVRKSRVLRDEALEAFPSYVPGSLPTVPGHEVVLRVVAVGSGVTSAVVGGRYVVQANFRDLATAESNGAFGYNFEGGLQQYVLLDERVTIAADGESCLLPAPDEPSASQLALVEPWACVEHAFANRERRELRAGGTVLVVGPGELTGVDLSGSGRRLCTEASTGLTLVDPAGLAAQSVDDLLYCGADAAELERLLPLVAGDGLILVATRGGRFGRLVDVPVGRVHYQNLRIAATTTGAFADCLDVVPATAELRDGDHVTVVGAGGSTGVMAMARAIAASRPGTLVEGAVRNPLRAAALRRRVARAAADRGVEVRLFDPEAERPRGPVDYCIVMAPVPDLIRSAIGEAAEGGIINVFAGIPTDLPCPVDLDAYAAKRLYLVGTSGSGVADMDAVLAKLTEGRLDTNLPLAGVSGMAGALDGLDAVRDRSIPGKIVVYPGLADLPLLGLDELVARHPSIGPLLREGCWTGPAEQELLRLATSSPASASSPATTTVTASTTTVTDRVVPTQGTDRAVVRIREALAEEAGQLSALALRSKGHWGYDEAFLESCREELTLRPADLAAHRTVVAERDGRILGFSTLEADPPVGALGMLFVAPEAIGQGVGRLLYTHALATARELGFERLTIDADPNAEAFYLAMGARLVGRTPSGSIPGRVLPQLLVTL